MKDIKLKETKQDITTLNKKDVFEHYTKQKDVKKKSDQNQKDVTDVSDPTKKATNTVVGREKKTAVESAYMAKQYAKKYVIGKITSRNSLKQVQNQGRKKLDQTSKRRM